MEKIKALWHGVPFFDTATRKWLVTFEIESQPAEFCKLKDKLLSLTVKPWREKRSLNANAYFHVLVGKIAEVLGVSHTEVHNIVLADYGYRDESIPNILLRSDIVWERIDSMHLKPTSKYSFVNGECYREYEMMRGSHTYDTKEMARFVDGVVFEAKALGIETATPEELERMKQQWNLN